MATSDIKKGPLYVDSASGRVGIGTSAPTASKLQVDGTDGTIARFRTTSGANNGVINITSSDAASTAGFSVGGNSSFPAMTFENGGAERMRLDSSGKLGLGTTLPQSALHINAANGAGNFIRLHDGNPSYGFGMGCGSSGDLIFSSYDGGNPQEFMRIDRNQGYITKPNQVAFGGYASPTGSGNRTYVSGTYHRKTNYGTATQETAFNVGSHFNTTTGIFTAPIQGTYVFHMRYSQGLANGRKIYQFQMPNGNFIEIAEDYLQHGDEHAAILVKMNANDSVSTGLHSGIENDVTVYFSGYLLG